MRRSASDRKRWTSVVCPSLVTVVLEESYGRDAPISVKRPLGAVLWSCGVADGIDDLGVAAGPRSDATTTGPSARVACLKAR